MSEHLKQATEIARIYPNSYLFFYYASINLFTGFLILSSYESLQMYAFFLAIFFIFQIINFFRNPSAEERIHTFLYSMIVLSGTIIPIGLKKEGDFVLNDVQNVTVEVVKKFGKKALKINIPEVVPNFSSSLIAIFIVLFGFGLYFLINDIVKKKLINIVNCLFSGLATVFILASRFKDIFFKECCKKMVYDGIAIDCIEIIIFASACILDLFWDKLNLKPAQKAYIISVLSIRLFIFFLAIIYLKNNIIHCLEAMWIIFSLLGFLLWF